MSATTGINDTANPASSFAKTLNDVTEAWLKEFPRIQTETPQLSHYTTAEGLLGICDSNALWATSARYSNDSSEVVYAAEIARGVLDKVFAGRTLTPVCSAVRSQLELSLDGITGCDPSHDGYIVSFCEASDLLSQWRAYGKRAGFEIRFNSLTAAVPLLQTFMLDVGSPAIGRILINKVEYDRRKQEMKLASLCEHSIEITKRFEHLTAAPRIAAWLASLHFAEWLYTVKHPKFEEEREWRIIAFPKTNFFDGGPEIERPDALKFRVGQHSVVPYVELSPEKGKRLPIAEVVCGPGGHDVLTAQAVNLLLRAKRFTGVRVRNSEVPLSYSANA